MNIQMNGHRLFDSLPIATKPDWKPVTEVFLIKLTSLAAEMLAASSVLAPLAVVICFYD